MERMLANLVIALGLVACTGCATTRIVGERGDAGTQGDSSTQGDASTDDGAVHAGPQVFYAPGAPLDAATRFGGAEDPARAPVVVYPLDGVVVPPNLRELAVHFLPGAGNSLFELTLKNAVVDVTVYLTCMPLGAGCAYVFDDPVWDAVAMPGRNGTPVTLRLRGVDGAAPGAVGISGTQTLSFTREDMLGGVYYTAEDSDPLRRASSGIMRYEFGRRGLRAEVYYSSAKGPGTTCAGCHAVSRNGARMALSWGRDILVLDVATRAVLWTGVGPVGMGSYFYMSFSADASQVVTSDGLFLRLHDGATGATLVDPLDANGSMPDMAPDDQSVVFARTGVPPACGDPMYCREMYVEQASLRMLHRSAAGWDPSVPLVDSDGRNNYYPSFSPDGQWVIFNRAAATSTSIDAPDASVWMVPADARLPPVELARGSAGAAASWPKWAPFSQTVGGERVFWLAFSSRRAYGLAPDFYLGSPLAQMWLVAVSPARAARGEDPSFPALYLPFQGRTTDNRIPQWVERVDRQPCSADTDCGLGEFCETGYCVPIID